MTCEEKQREARKRSLSLYLTVQTAILAAMLILSGVDLYQQGDVYESSIMPYIGDLLDCTGVLAFATLAVHVVWQVRLSWRQRCFTTVGYVMMYMLSYSMLSLAGQYHASRSGLHRWNGTGLAVVDENIWHARGVFWQPLTSARGERISQATLLGHFYSPLIRADRRFWHDSYNMFEGDLNEWLPEHPDAR